MPINIPKLIYFASAFCSKKVQVTIAIPVHSRNFSTLNKSRFFLFICQSACYLENLLKTFYLKLHTNSKVNLSLQPSHTQVLSSNSPCHLPYNSYGVRAENFELDQPVIP